MSGAILNALVTILGTLIVIFAMVMIGRSCFALIFSEQEYLAKKMLVRIPLMFGLVIIGMLLSSCGASPNQWATIGKAFVSAIAGSLTIQFSAVILGFILIFRGLCAIISTKMSLKRKATECYICGH